MPTVLVSQAPIPPENDALAILPARTSYECTFARALTHKNVSFINDKSMRVGCRIVVGSEDGHVAVASSVLTSVQTDRVVVITKRLIQAPRNRNVKAKVYRKDVIGHHQHLFSGRKSFIKRQDIPSYEQREACMDTVWRIDSDEGSVGLGQARGNLSRLFVVDGRVPSKLCRLIVDLETPRFGSMQ